MSNELTMERRSNLVMPTHYVELTEEEMSYVTGGYHISTRYTGIAAGIAGFLVDFVGLSAAGFAAAALVGVNLAKLGAKKAASAIIKNLAGFLCGASLAILILQSIHIVTFLAVAITGLCQVGYFDVHHVGIHIFGAPLELAKYITY